jgi:hypothetical protein
MSRWFRHYAGMMRDEKLVRVAVQSKQPVERVVWVWGAILESAAEINDGGRYELDCGEVAYFLRCDLADVQRVLDGMADLGRVAAGVVVKWGDRQFESDTSRERQKRYRDRKKHNGDDVSRDGDASMGKGDVTPPSPDGEVTPQETETETENTTRDARASLNDLDGKLRDAAGGALDRSSVSLEVLSDPLAWIGGGADLDLDIVPTIRARCAKARPGSIRGWAYFTQAIADARDRRLKGLPPASIVPFTRENRHDVPTTSQILRAKAAELRAEAENGLHPGAGGDHARLLPGTG